MKDGQTIITVEGMGPDAEVTTNAAGGQQSLAPNAFHLIDPYVAMEILDIMKLPKFAIDAGLVLTEDTNKYINAFKQCLDYMGTYQDVYMIKAMELVEPNPFVIIQTIAGRLMYGITKGNNGKGYKTNNWRLINREEHLNHAMNHLYALIMGDTQDDHRSAVICRLHMALATKESRNFRYQEYVENVEPEVPVLEKIQKRYNDLKENPLNYDQRPCRIPEDFAPGEIIEVEQ